MNVQPYLGWWSPMTQSCSGEETMMQGGAPSGIWLVDHPQEYEFDTTNINSSETLEVETGPFRTGHLCCRWRRNPPSRAVVRKRGIRRPMRAAWRELSWGNPWCGIPRFSCRFNQHSLDFIWIKMGMSLTRLKSLIGCNPWNMVF